MKYVLDTNILVHKIRNNEAWKTIEKTYFPKGIKNFAVISFATRAEIRSLAIQLKWEKGRLLRMEQFIKQLKVIHSIELNLERFYAQIDTFSQNKHKSLKLPEEMSARNMGKNDIWIAATAAHQGIGLLTTDRDFEHLDNVFLKLIYIDINKNQNAL